MPQNINKGKENVENKNEIDYKYKNEINYKYILTCEREYGKLNKA